MSKKTTTLIGESANFLAVVGPTATGKTNFVIKSLAKTVLKQEKFNQVWIVSADSRQIYRDIPIVSGADIPNGYQLTQTVTLENKNQTSFLSKPDHLDYWFQDKIRIYGVSVLEANEDWSAADFRNLVMDVLSMADEKVLVVVVGGSGFYYRYLFQDSPEMISAPNSKIREEAQTKSISELQDWLKKLSHETFAELNESDRVNRRRLVRKIEQLSMDEVDELETELWKPMPQMFTLGLSMDRKALREKISARVRSRWQKGAIQEVDSLFDRYDKDFEEFQLSTATGVKEILEHIQGKVSGNDAIETWISREYGYAKRQLTWFKKEPGIEWFDVQDKNWMVASLTKLDQFLS